jgi:hypothetical protein
MIRKVVDYWNIGQQPFLYPSIRRKIENIMQSNLGSCGTGYQPNAAFSCRAYQECIHCAGGGNNIRFNPPMMLKQT